MATTEEGQEATVDIDEESLTVDDEGVAFEEEEHPPDEFPGHCMEKNGWAAAAHACKVCMLAEECKEKTLAAQREKREAALQESETDV